MTVSIATAFGAGLLTFLSPCVLPMVPIYLASLTTGDVTSLSPGQRRQLLGRATFFVLGFVSVFTVMGIGASQLGGLVAAHRTAFATTGGLVVLLLGLKFLGVVQIPWLDRVWRADDRGLKLQSGALQALVLGVLFAAAWSPCVGPVLGSILTYTATRTSDPLVGAGLLTAYGAGIALPLLGVALFADAGLGALRRIRRGLPYFERALGVLLVLVAGSLIFAWDVWQVSVPPALAQIEPTPQPTPTPANGAKGTMLALVSKDCPVCRGMEPVVAEVAKLCVGHDVHLEKIDVSLAPNRPFIDKYRLVGVPTYVFLRPDGEEVARLIGQQSRESLLQALSGLSGESCPGVGPVPQQENVSCPSTNTSATNAEAASIFSGKSSNATNPPPAPSAAPVASACSLPSPSAAAPTPAGAD